MHPHDLNHDHNHTLFNASNQTLGAVVVPWTTSRTATTTTATRNASAVSVWLRRVVDTLDRGPWEADPQLALKVAVVAPLACVLLCAICGVCYCYRKRQTSPCKRRAWPDSAVESQLDDTESADEEDDNDHEERYTPPCTDDDEHLETATQKDANNEHVDCEQAGMLSQSPAEAPAGSGKCRASLSATPSGQNNGHRVPEAHDGRKERSTGASSASSSRIWFP